MPRASLRDQCARNYFYGQDCRIESVLAQLEGGDETVLRRLRETLSLPTDRESRERLSLIAGRFERADGKSY